MKMSDTSVSDTGHHICIYGPPKSGKTLLAGLLASEFNVVLFDLEHGSLTLKQLPMEYQKNIELIRVPDDRSNYQAITTMLYVTEGKAVKVCDTHGKTGTCSICAIAKASGNTGNIGTMIDIDIERLGPDTVIIMDSMTQLSHSAMGKAFSGKQSETNIKPEYSHYTAQGYYLDRVLTAIQNSRANWVVICHEESLSQEDDSEKIVPMAGTRNFSRNTAKYFDHVVYTAIENYKYVVSSSALDSNKVLTGSRTGVSLKNNPDAQGLLSLLRHPKELAVDGARVAPEKKAAIKLPGVTAQTAVEPKDTSTMANPAMSAIDRAKAAMAAAAAKKK